MIEKESNQKTILSEAFLSFSGMSLGSVFRYMFSIIMARFLGAQMLGLYSLGNAITRIAEIMAFCVSLAEIQKTKKMLIDQYIAH
jgi:O-antigen/teichoic acid export membrane protein